MDHENKGIALKYSVDIPKILAIAQGELLKHLLKLAEKNNITIYKDPDLTEVLSRFEVGAEIPEVLYKTIAEVLAHCYKVNSDFREKIDKLGRDDWWKKVDWDNPTEVDKELDELSFYDQLLNTVGRGYACKPCLKKEDKLHKKYYAKS